MLYGTMEKMMCDLAKFKNSEIQGFWSGCEISMDLVHEHEYMIGISV